MTQQLTNAIVHHIFSGFLVLDSGLISPEKHKSLKDKEFLLDQITLLDEENNQIHNKVWGCQLRIDLNEVKILLVNLTTSRIQEYGMIFHLKENPVYGLYYSEDNSFISISLNSQDWMDCGTYLQANFLTGMEQIKENGLNWGKCSSYEEELKILKSFIDYSFSRDS